MKKYVIKIIILSFILLVGVQNIYANDSALNQNTEIKKPKGIVEGTPTAISSFLGSNLPKRVILWAKKIKPLGEEGEGDPWEGLNRYLYDFNNIVDVVAKPVARGYRRYTPDLIQVGVSNFFANLIDVNTLINQTLQFKFKEGFKSVGRIVLNTTLGLGGLLELQERPFHKEDFGQTLGYWGVGSGPYLVLPFLGPSTLRDGAGLVANITVFNESYEALINTEINLGTSLLNSVRARASLLQITDLLEKSEDPYVSLRNAYLQRRNYDIYDGHIQDNEEF